MDNRDKVGFKTVFADWPRYNDAVMLNILFLLINKYNMQTLQGCWREEEPYPGVETRNGQLHKW